MAVYVDYTQAPFGRMCGNSVCPDIVEALAGTNVPELMAREVVA